ncbi:NYN domain-containing protein [Shouchella lonarensis]|uniref:NYN domain-containing protein n=1 Tax=Shouchella lonarensis TaxID=1464122 RepID=A0A1G6LZC2_9BACI|nr:NYN domain-containing protein [Shouchella lonarensis]SDC48580.1 hypothetical protein SAMN05421737_10947 [Shouchella lonarensis]
MTHDILLVDGYNIIGAWAELQSLSKQDFSLARDRLVDMMAEYAAYMGHEVHIVFDAHQVGGVGKHALHHRVHVIYTRKKETADERIEKLVTTMKRIDRRIYVATSDFAEQSVIFGSGALRKSAHELQREMKLVMKGIDKTIEKKQRTQQSSKIQLSTEVAEVFERWRREGK